MKHYSELKPDGMHWLLHRGSWFAFNERAHFVEHQDGGFFADDNGVQIYSLKQGGMGKNKKPWVTP